jgi:hypothetical protein
LRKRKESIPVRCMSADYIIRDSNGGQVIA